VYSPAPILGTEEALPKTVAAEAAPVAAAAPSTVVAPAPVAETQAPAAAAAASPAEFTEKDTVQAQAKGNKGELTWKKAVVKAVTADGYTVAFDGAKDGETVNVTKSQVRALERNSASSCIVA
jgi:hypothetical protein